MKCLYVAATEEVEREALAAVRVAPPAARPNAAFVEALARLDASRR